MNGKRLDKALALEQAAGDGLLHEGRPAADLGSERQSGGRQFLTTGSPVAKLGHPNAAEVRHDAGLPPPRDLAYYDCPITTAGLEGTNKIKTLQRQAYGFRDQEFFKLKIYALHETTYALVG